VLVIFEELLEEGEGEGECRIGWEEEMGEESGRADVRDRGRVGLRGEEVG
jgi:hypothetical protein